MYLRGRKGEREREKRWRAICRLIVAFLSGSLSLEGTGARSRVMFSVRTLRSGSSHIQAARRARDTESKKHLVMLKLARFTAFFFPIAGAPIVYCPFLFAFFFSRYTCSFYDRITGSRPFDASASSFTRASTITSYLSAIYV